MKSAANEADIQGRLIRRMLDARHSRLADKKASIEAIRAEMAVDEAVVAQLEEELASIPSDAAQPETNGVASLPKTVSAEPGVGTLAQKIVQVLRTAKGPLHGHEIAERLQEMGVKSVSPKGLLPGVFAVFKRRQDLFRKIERGVYALAEAKDEGQGGE